VFLLYSAGAEYLLLACIVYAPGTLLFLMARREQRLRAFNRPEVVICVLLWTAAVVGIVAISTGYVDI
jgi:arginine:ornithine antiporter/lysine permease